MIYLSSHLRQIIDEFDTQYDKVNAGDVISFFYNGEKKYVFVLNEDGNGYLHALKLDNVDRMTIKYLMLTMFAQEPLAFYKSHISKNPKLQDAHAYRTYDQKKISTVRYIIYNFDINQAHTNTLLMSDASLILGLNSDHHPYIERNPGLLGLVTKRAGKYGIYVPDPAVSPETQMYLKKLGRFKFLRTWTYQPRKDETLSAEELEKRTNEQLRQIASSGGVYFMYDEDIEKFSNIIGAQPV